MTKAHMTVIYPISVEVDFDESRRGDEEYLEQKREEAKDLSEKILESSTIKPVIHDSSEPELIE